MAGFRLGPRGRKVATTGGRAASYSIRWEPGSLARSASRPALRASNGARRRPSSRSRREDSSHSFRLRRPGYRRAAAAGSSGRWSAPP